MRDHRCLFVATLVSALSLQSSGEEGGDGALRWTGLTRARQGQWLEWKSRMRRELHGRFCEGGGVKLPPLLDRGVRPT